jgi:hypothetical protein
MGNILKNFIPSQKIELLLSQKMLRRIDFDKSVGRHFGRFFKN